MEEIYLAYAGILTLATTTIYSGAWGSLPPPRKTKKTEDERKKVVVATEDEESDEEPDVDERISSSDAYLFPIIASAALFGFYLVFKYLGPEWVNYLLGWYFAFMGVGSVWKTSVSLLRTTLGRKFWRSFRRTRFRLGISGHEVISVRFRTPVPYLLPVAIVPSVIYMLADKKPALATNVLALSFAYNALCLLKVDSFRTGTILLSGLFLYDIYWVFGTEVMVKVATTLDAPIKILWPKAMDFSTEKGFTMLGLGDIVIPGAFITLALRRDLFVSGHRNPYASFAKPYFIASMVAYVLGLVTTVAIMHTFKAAQPALLYLSPACIFSFLFTAVRRGELKEAWSWTDESDEEVEKKKKGTEAKAAQPEKDSAQSD